MLTASARLRKERDVQRVRRFGRSAHGSALTVRAFLAHKEQSRLTIVVSKKIDRRASKRNQVKRRIRAQVRNIYPDIKRGHDILILTRPGAQDLHAQEIRKSLIQLFQKLKLFT